MSEDLMIKGVSVFVLTLLFLSIYFSQKISPSGMFYGVLLGKENKNKKEVIEVDRRFKLRAGIIYAVGLVLGMVMLSIKGVKSPLSLLAIIFISLVFYMVFYGAAHKEAKKLKKTYGISEKKKGKKIIDTEFMKQRSKIKKVFGFLYVLPLLAVVAGAIYTFYHYPSLPSRIPTHWGITGKADAWSQKSYMTVFFPIFAEFFIVVLFTIMSQGIFTSRIKLDGENLKESRENAIKYLVGISVSLYLLIGTIVLLFSSITVALVKGSEISTTFMVWVLIGLLLAILIMIYFYYRYQGAGFSKEKKEEGYSPEDEDKYWVWGSFYNNPDDPSVMVPKRYGVGWTLNIGSKKGKAVLLFTLAFVLILLVISFSFS